MVVRRHLDRVAARLPPSADGFQPATDASDAKRVRKDPPYFAESGVKADMRNYAALVVLLLPLAGQAQTNANQNVVFDVASVKPNTSGAPMRLGPTLQASGRVLTADLYAGERRSGRQDGTAVETRRHGLRAACAAHAGRRRATPAAAAGGGWHSADGQLGSP